MEGELFESRERALCPPVSVLGQLLDARPINRDDAEFAGDEETVGQDEEQNGEDAERGFYVCSPQGITRAQG